MMQSIHSQSFYICVYIYYMSHGLHVSTSLIEGPDDGLKYREVETCSPCDI